MNNDDFSEKTIRILHGLMRRELEEISEYMKGTRNCLLETPFPAMDVFMKKHKLHIMIELPGLKAEDFSLYLYGKNMIIEGKRPLYCFGGSATFIRTERDRSSFKRVFEIPDFINPDTITAKLRNGVLDIVMLKIGTEDLEGGE